MKKTKNLFAALCTLAFLAFLSACNKAPQEPPARISLYEMGEDGPKYYRIPALTKAKDEETPLQKKLNQLLPTSAAMRWATCRTSLPSFPSEAPTVERLGAK